eukprot:86026-Prymnesium_polylepis.3
MSALDRQGSEHGLSDSTYVTQQPRFFASRQLTAVMRAGRPVVREALVQLKVARTFRLASWGHRIVIWAQKLKTKVLK